jgi:CRISPR-associated protein Cas2
MCEIAPGVYTSPRMAAGVRERVWTVLADWFEPKADHAILMTWPDPELQGGQAVRVLGVPRQELCDFHGVYLARREVDAAESEGLERATGQDVGSPPDPAS